MSYELLFITRGISVTHLLWHLPAISEYFGIKQENRVKLDRTTKL